MRRLMALGVGVAVLALASLPARAFPGRCLLQVDRHTYLDGPCNIDLLGEGGFSIGTGEHAARYFAYVLTEPDTGRVTGAWNGVYAGSHAHENLGELIRHGACWVNARARICAWR
jgi:hypothetical protein